MTDDMANDVSQVTDFHFHTCRKFRIFPSSATSSTGQNVRNRLATSSQLGVSFAVVSDSGMVCFQTKSIQDYKVTRGNMNVEVADLPMKTVAFAGISSINDMGINSDGTLLAILHTVNNDVSVDVFDIRTLCSAANSGPFKPICQTRVGTDSTNQGSAFEWNPAFPDTFAASSTDRSILVAKIDVSNPSSQKLVGIGKLGAVTTVISWSPKGKQLTIGDSLGKVVQLKPELDVVRSQFGPDHQPPYGKVTGLCWLATTEWLVSFANGADHDAYLMRCKKDKPTEWIHFHELSYASSKWPLPAQLLPATQLLIDWNIVLFGNSKTSEIVTVGKREDWTTWVTVEGEAIYLPTTASGADTVPIGISIDRTQTEEVLLKPDGSKKHHPSPLVLCLTNDGILTAHHVISTFEPHKSCQIQSQNILISGLSKAMTAAPTSKPSTLFEQKPVTSASPLLTAALAPKPTSSVFGGTPTAAPSSIFGAGAGAAGSTTATPPKSSLFTSAASLAAPTTTSAPVPPAASAAAAAPAVQVETPKVPSPPPEPTTPPEVKRAQQLAIKKKTLIDRIQKTNAIQTSAKDAVMKMSFAVGSAKVSILECAEVVKASLEDSKEVTDELKNLLSSIEWMADRTKHAVKEMDFEIEEKMEFVSNEEDGERILEKLRDMSENEKMMRFNKLETTADMLNGKFAECSEQIRKLRRTLAEKESLRKQAVLSPLRTNSNLNQLRSGSETEVALRVMRNVTKIIMDTRERIQRTELEFIHFQRDVKAFKETSKANTTTSRKHADISILEEDDAPHRRNLTDGEIMKARKALVQRIQKRGPVKTKDVKVETFRKVAPGQQKKKDEVMDTANLSNAIMKLSMTPRRVMGTSSLFSPSAAMSSVKRDATTQADEPAVVKTVVVTVESPARPAPAAPIVSTPISQTATTSSTAPVTSSKLSLPSKDEPKTVPAATPAPSSSIFSGSLFNTKPAASTAVGTSPMPLPKSSSIFGSPLSNSVKEPEKATTPEPSVVPVQAAKEESKKTEEVPKTPVVTPKIEEVKPEETTTLEAPKVEQKTPEPVVTAPPETPTPVVVVEEKKEVQATPEVPKTPSFSFNTGASAAQTTPKAASSIFGGGLKAQEATSPAATSSIFGAAAKSSPAAASGSATSIFGGGAKSGSSPFGSFGQGVAQPAQAAAAPAGGVSFSFNTAAANVSQPKPSFGSFGAPPSTAKPGSVFGAAAAAAATSPSIPNVDDGMEDDSMVNAGGPGGFMSGLGNSGNTANASGGNNPFAPKPSTGSAASSSWLFSGSGNGGNQQPTKPSFSFTNAASQPQAAASSSGTSSVFGAAPKFGSQPVFGAKPFGGGAAAGGAGGGLSKNASIFGGAAATSSPSSGGGFAQFATGQGTSSLFGGSGAPQPNTSIFGGGANTPAAPSSSIFGGGSSANSNKPASFSSWR